MKPTSAPPRPASGAALDPGPGVARRRALQRLALQAWPLRWAVTGAAPALLGCGGGGGAAAAAPVPAPPPPLPPPPPPPPPSAQIQRLKAALLQPAMVLAPAGITVTQGQGNNPVSGFGATARVQPPFNNDNSLSLASLPAVWGHRRDIWTVPARGVAQIAGVSVYPVQRRHPAATLGSEGVCGLHFRLRGRAFEVLMAGANVSLTVVADGTVVGGGWFDTALSPAGPGPRLNEPNTLVRVDFGSAAPRQVALYARSAQGPCALVLDDSDELQAWDRSGEASMAAMADSYGGAPGRVWSSGGPLWEAAALLGIAHVDINAIGGTGFAPNSVPGRGNPDDAFEARLITATAGAPDIFFTAGGINDNNSMALFPYGSADAARAGFDAAARSYFRALRAALPQSLLVALGPWAPRESVPTNAAELSKAETVREALAAVGGPWVFLDNLRGGWTCSSGAGASGSGPWQTGTGHVGAPTGQGNGDLYVSGDGTHPTVAGVAHLGAQIAAGVRAALATL